MVIHSCMNRHSFRPEYVGKRVKTAHFMPSRSHHKSTFLDPGFPFPWIGAWEHTIGDRIRAHTSEELNRCSLCHLLQPIAMTQETPFIPGNATALCVPCHAWKVCGRIAVFKGDGLKSATCARVTPITADRPIVRPSNGYPRPTRPIPI